jgi:hypothetical protein
MESAAGKGNDPGKNASGASWDENRASWVLGGM